MSDSSSTVSESVMVPLDRIATDDKGQTRVKVRPAVVREYAAAMAEQIAEGGLRFPPVLLFKDGGDFYWLGDGFHRVVAARKAGLTEIAAEVREGTQRDALLFGICTNSTHGLPRSNADRRHAVALVFADPEWSQWNDREIARRIQVSNVLVSKMRRSVSVNGLQIEGRKVQRGDSVYEMNVGAKAATDDTAKTEPATLVTPTELLGIPLPDGRGPAFAAAADFQEAQDLFDRLSALLDRIAQGPAGEVYRLELVRTANHGKAGYACPAVRAARNKLVAAEPYCGYCPSCTAQRPDRGYSSCKVCGGLGWTSRAAFELCRECDRQQILKLRTANPK
jgi:ribosomal protein S14